MMSERFTAWTLSLAQRDGVLGMLFVLAACLVFASVVIAGQLDNKGRARFNVAFPLVWFIVFYGALIVLVAK